MSPKRSSTGAYCVKCKESNERHTCAIAHDSRHCYHLLMKKPSLALLLATLAVASVLSACSPKFDWRDYRSPDAQFTALFPGKPAVLTREIDLDGKKVSLTMTASEVDGNTFAIGSAVLDSALLTRDWEQAAAQLEPRFRLVKVDTEANQALGARFNIRSIPTLALFANGVEVARQPGAMGAADIVRWAQSQRR